MKKMTFLRNRLLVATAATAVLASWVAPVSTASAAVSVGPQTVYDAVLDRLPPNLVSQPFQAQQTAEFGDHIALAGTNRVLQSATVTMSTWAKYSEWAGLPAAGWQHPITLTVYNVNDNSVDPPALGTPIESITQTFDIPWRPEDTPECRVGAWRPRGKTCYSGMAFNIEFDLTSIGAVPDEFIYGIAYNTQTWGYSPIGEPGPYNSLNVGLIDADDYPGQPTVGTDVEPDAVFWNTATAGLYSDGGPGGTFRRDTGWTGYTPAVMFAASGTPSECFFTQSGTTMTLQGDCQTDRTVLVPDGFTLDGNHHTITAVDPSVGHFLGAVVKNEATTSPITVKNLRVTTAGLTNVCDDGVDRLRGIMFDGVGGTIAGNTVLHINQGASGCQEGNAIEVRNAPFDTTGPDVTVTISRNVTTDYQKTGIVTNGSVLAKITGNTVTGVGPVDYIAQNGIQVGFGGSAAVTGNTVSGNDYTPTGEEACGILLYQEGAVSSSRNTLFANEEDTCDY